MPRTTEKVWERCCAWKQITHGNYDHPDLDLEAEHQGYVTQIERHRAKLRAIDEAHGVPQLAARADALWAECNAAYERLFACPAQTMEGVALKLRLGAAWEEVLTVAPEHEMGFALMAALKDAERLSGRAS